MRVGERTLHIEAGQIALLPPNVEHAGADIITSDVDFYWMHFKLPDARALPDAANLPQDDHCLLLPDERTLPDPDRLAVMCGQLIDIYARFGPYSNAYCDYFATGLLLEASAQERLKADFATHRTLAGYRGDGKPITSMVVPGKSGSKLSWTMALGLDSRNRRISQRLMDRMALMVRLRALIAGHRCRRRFHPA